MRADGLTKRGYETKSGAKRALRYMRQRVAGHDLNVYRCTASDCGLWHVGNKWSW